MFSHLRRKKERKTSMLNEVSLGELLMKWIFGWNSENMFLWSGKKMNLNQTKINGSDNLERTVFV